MNSEDITRIVQAELAEKPDLSNGHGVEVDKCLIEPTMQQYKDPLKDSIMFDLWTVLEETSDGDGYKIVYDPEKRMYGLGMITDKDELVFLGHYGTFAETLRSM